MTPLKSSHLAGAAHDPATGTLVVHFNDGSSHAYHDVPTKVYQELLAAKSAGSYFSGAIKPHFKSSPLARAKPPP